MLIRSAEMRDVDALLEIYRPFVERTWVSFEEETPDRDEFADRVKTATEGWAWLVAETEHGIAGYAYGTAHRVRAAYRWSVEVSAYMAASARRMGIASRLYAALFEALESRGFHNAYAGIALPNEASVAFHERMGFRQIGVFPRIGRKFDTWIDVAWYHRPLDQDPGTEVDP